jgi:hypothetical protein
MTETYVEKTESARKVRAALRKAFPKTKISVTNGFSDIHVKWEDSGPAPKQLTAALIAAGVAQLDPSWGDIEYVTVDRHHLWLNCYNVAAREAAQRNFERRRQEDEIERQREQEAVKQARTARRWPALAPRHNPPPDPAVYAAFERLREQAEARVSHDGERRPSWAPPLLLGDELAAACLELGYLTEDDQPVGRLWGQFASPKRTGRALREEVSKLSLRGVACRGFQLFAGGTGSRCLTCCLRHNASKTARGGLGRTTVRSNTAARASAGGRS